jgi:uncharacterized membrane protein YdjX (TVP38/TMEM64 family)
VIGISLSLGLGFGSVWGGVGVWCGLAGGWLVAVLVGSTAARPWGSNVRFAAAGKNSDSLQRN